MLEKLKSSLEKQHQQRIKEIVEKKEYPTSRHPHYISFKYALDGLSWAFKSQPNIQIHLLVFLLVSLLALFLNQYVVVTLIEYVLILVSSSIVITAEMFNSALEALSDEVADGKYKEFIRIAKDTSSGAVLVSALFSVVIGIIILGPKILFLLSL